MEIKAPTIMKAAKKSAGVIATPLDNRVLFIPLKPRCTSGYLLNLVNM